MRALTNIIEELTECRKEVERAKEPEMSKKNETDKVKQVKSVAQTVAVMYAIAGVFLLLLTLRFVGALLGIVSPPQTDDTSFIGILLNLMYTTGAGNILGTLSFGVITLLFFTQVYGLWRLKKWALYVTAVSTCLLFVFVLVTVITNPNVSPYIGLVSLFSGLFLAYLHNVRQCFSN